MEIEGLKELLPLLIPLLLLELGLMAAALVDLSRRERVRGGNKLVWVLAIVLINLFGPLAYFLFGREE
ncbi:MAG: PLD nuclease N-terminal domain-containing protein [Anaerolineae bacterium]